MRKRISIAAALLIALLVITGCSGSDKSKLPVPEDMKGTWIDSEGQRMVVSDDNIIYEELSGTTNFSDVIRVTPNLYEITYTDTTLTITSDRLGIKYEFSVNGNILTFRMTFGGLGSPIEFTKQGS